jgi:glycosyltransferase 2 family protein
MLSSGGELWEKIAMSLRQLKVLSVAFALVGLLLGTLLIGWFGIGRVAATLLRVGWGGFALVCAWQMVLFVILGSAWAAIVPERRLGMRCFIWARMVRDAAGNCLPFSRIGGFAVGGRAIMQAGLGWAAATASIVADMTIEFLGQILFIATGLIILLSQVPNSPIATPLAVGLGLALLAGVALPCLLWRSAGSVLFARLLDRISFRLFHNETDGLALQVELSRMTRVSGRLPRAVALHLLGWFGTGVAGWIGFRMVGAPIGLLPALAIEGLLYGALTASFFVPGNIGVQEAAYVGLAAAFGVPPQAALSVSLLRRARDMALGIPILLAWQATELRRLRKATKDLGTL